jgi:hypothetical protein
MTEFEDRTAIERSGKRWAAGIIALVVAVVGFLSWRVTRADGDGDLGGDAKRACQEDVIPKRLKAPATASFTGVSVTFDGTAYTVAGSVDSENSYGAKIRASFNCVMHADGKRWVVESATVSG